MKKKTEMFSNPKEKRAEIDDMLAIAQELTDAGYGDICFIEETGRKELTTNERKKGKWIDYTDDGYVECPFCHSATNCDGNKDELHYCFSCGADMRGEQAATTDIISV